MADENDAEQGAPARCMPCHGSGQVISGLGGEPRNVPCPWCDGTGVFIAEHDAQARWRGEEPADQASAPEVE